MFKKIAFSFLLTIFPLFTVSAHYLWVEAQGSGILGQKHQVRVHYGEYTYGLVEQVKGENFPLVSKFTLWLIAPDGSRKELASKAMEDHFQAHFVPSQNGVYTLALNNNEIDVIDYTEYDFGIFKTHYHATAKVRVGGSDADTRASNPDGIVVKQLAQSGEDIRLQVLYKGKPLAGNELVVYVSDLWSKTLTTDDSGQVSFSLPWDTKYLVETTIKEEVPGNYKGEDYQFIWHCATFCIL